MEPKLREYIEHLFVNAPHTEQANDLKEEIIRNTIERYHDLVADGKPEGEAYNLAIAGIGDINELLSELGVSPVDISSDENKLIQIKTRSTVFKSIAVALYILCIIPPICFSIVNCSNFGAIVMFLMISTATGLLIYNRNTQFLPFANDPNIVKSAKTRAIMRAVAVGLYISCPVPAIFSSMVYINGVLGALGLLIMVAAATVLMIISKNYTPYLNTENETSESFKAFNSAKKQYPPIYRVIVAVLWITISILYLLITFAGIQTASTAVYGISWIIFILGVALQQLIKAIFDYMEASK